MTGFQGAVMYCVWSLRLAFFFSLHVIYPLWNRETPGGVWFPHIIFSFLSNAVSRQIWIQNNLSIDVKRNHVAIEKCLFENSLLWSFFQVLHSSQVHNMFIVCQQPWIPCREQFQEEWDWWVKQSKELSSRYRKLVNLCLHFGINTLFHHPLKSVIRSQEAQDQREINERDANDICFSQVANVQPKWHFVCPNKDVMKTNVKNRISTYFLWCPVFQSISQSMEFQQQMPRVQDQTAHLYLSDDPELIMVL